MSALDYISYSRVNRFMACPRSYYYHYVERVPRPVASWLFLGGCVHEAIGYNFSQKVKSQTDLSLEEVRSVFSDRWDKQDLDTNRPAYSDSAEATGIDWQDDSPGLLKDVGLEAVSKYHVKMAPQVQPVAVEMDFPNATICGIKLVGRIDVIDSDATVLDLKTAKRKPATSDIEANLQPTFYAAGLGGGINFKFHYMIKAAATEVAEFKTKRTNDDIQFLEQEFLPPIIESIEQGIFVPNVTGWKCNPKYCEFFELCQRTPKRQKSEQ